MRCEPVVTDIAPMTELRRNCEHLPVNEASRRPRHNAAPEIVRDACPISSVLRISQIADKTDKPGVTCFITNTLCGQGRRGKGETDSSYLIFWIIRLF